MGDLAADCTVTQDELSACDHTGAPASGYRLRQSPEKKEAFDKVKDLRQFIRLLSEQGRLVRVCEATDWKFEIGRMTRARQRPLLFENIKGYPGQRVFTNGLCDTASIALALGMNPASTRATLIKEAKERIRKPVKPVLVHAGPVFENVILATKVNLLQLPVPHWSEHDGGRYLGTWHINVTKDPATGSRNVGVYRMQLLDEKHATISASPRSHLAQHVAQAEKDGRPLPMAVAIGVSEAVMMAAAAAYPAGMDEYELAGALCQRPLSLLQCQTVNLEIPANSEIVIEGLIQPGVRVQDGPYFDYTGNPNTNPSAFLFEATGLMFRSNPIFRGAAIGVPGAEDHQLFAFLSKLGLVDFHGSRIKQAVQDILLQQHLFRAFQLAGRLAGGVAEMFRGSRKSSSVGRNAARHGIS